MGEGGPARHDAHGEGAGAGAHHAGRQLELPGGHRAITDLGALRDLAGSLAEGVAAHRAQIARRLDTPVVVQFDEPLLPAALAGRLTGVTSLNPVHPVDESVATGLLDDCVATVGADVVLHSCAAELPWKMLQRSTLHAVSVDVQTLTPSDLDGIGEFVDSGRTVLLGVVGAATPERPPSAEELATRVVSITDRLGFRTVGATRADRRHAGLRAGGSHAGVGTQSHRAHPEDRRRHRRRPGRHLSRSFGNCFTA